MSLVVYLNAADVDDLKAAKEFYAARCAACHGNNGKGDGAASAALKPKPRDFSDTNYWLKADDAKIIKIILEGGAKNKLSPLMPPHNDLKKETAVQMVQLLRSFSGDKPKTNPEEKKNGDKDIDTKKDVDSKDSSKTDKNTDIKEGEDSKTGSANDTVEKKK